MEQKVFKPGSLFLDSDKTTKLFFLLIFAFCGLVFSLLIVYVLMSKFNLPLNTSEFFILSVVVDFFLLSLFYFWDIKSRELRSIIATGNLLSYSGRFILVRKSTNLTSIKAIKFFTTAVQGGKTGPLPSYKIILTDKENQITTIYLGQWDIDSLKPLSRYLKDKYPQIEYSSEFKDDTLFHEVTSKYSTVSESQFRHDNQLS